jgi:hypothetical protein
MWVYADVPPIKVRQAGRLDRTTAQHLPLVAAELIADGARLVTHRLILGDLRPYPASGPRSQLEQGSGGVDRCRRRSR